MVAFTLFKNSNPFFPTTKKSVVARSFSWRTFLSNFVFNHPHNPLSEVTTITAVLVAFVFSLS